MGQRTGGHCVRGDRVDWGSAVAVVLGFAALRVVAAAEIPLLHAETYYWLWSGHPAWGYYDHPPGVALLIGLGSPLLPHTALGLRLGHVVLSSFGALLFYALCLRLVAPPAAFASLVALCAAPLWFPFGVVATPDGPLLFCWVLALLLFHRAWSGDALWPWLATGAATGLTILSKYNGFLLPGVFLAFLLLDPRGRRALRGVRPYLGLAVALLVAAPNLVWNAHHGGETLDTPLRNGVELDRALGHFAEYLGLPVLMLTPLLAFGWVRQTAIGIARGRLWRDATFQFAFCASWLPLSAFAFVSILTEIHWQWIATCLVTALPLTFENFGSAGEGASPRFLRAALASELGLVALLGVGALVALAVVGPGPPGRHPRGLAGLALELRGWPELEARLDREIAKRSGSRFFLGSLNYHLTSHLEWLTDARVPALPLDPGRSHEYLYWHRHTDFIGWDGLVVDKVNLERRDQRDLAEACTSLEPLEPVSVEIGGERRERFSVFWCRGYRGLGDASAGGAAP
jgi:4-amino-4-deoxy-L-arabinose transferase-like glycosyltransferase